MKTMRSTRRQRPSDTARRGTAQMELALFLPLYVTAILILLTIFSYARTRSQVAVESRHRAWLQRDRFGDGTQSLPAAASEAASVGRILAGEQDPVQGVVSARKSDDASVFLKSLDLVTSMRKEHFVLTDPWDYRVLPFETRAEHPRLVLARRTRVFGGMDRGAMQGLSAAAAIGAEDASRLNGRLTRRRNDARREIAAAMERVEREIQQRQNERQQHEDELWQLQNQQPPDEDRIDEVRSRISALNREIEQLEAKIADLRQAAQLVG